MTKTARVGWIGFGATAALIAAITLTPQSQTSAHHGVSATILRFLHAIGVPAGFNAVHWEFVANILMFIPLGFFLALALPKGRIWLGLVLLPLISASIEISQLLLLPSRYPTLQDVLANSTGGWIGLAAGAGLVWMMARRQPTLTY